MDRANIERLATAVEALNSGELEPFVGLLSNDMVWKGQSQGWLWWRETPS